MSDAKVDLFERLRSNNFVPKQKHIPTENVTHTNRCLKQSSILLSSAVIIGFPLFYITSKYALPSFRDFSVHNVADRSDKRLTFSQMPFEQ